MAVSDHMKRAPTDHMIIDHVYNPLPPTIKQSTEEHILTHPQHPFTELEVQVMEIRKKKLGADHPTSMNNLAPTWKEEDRDAEAIGLMRECVRGF